MCSGEYSHVVIMWCLWRVTINNQTYHGDHFEMYRNAETLHVYQELTWCCRSIILQKQTCKLIQKRFTLWLPETVLGGRELKVVKRYKLLYIRQMWTRDVRYSMVNIISIVVCYIWGLPWQLIGKESACQCRRCNRHEFSPWVRKSPWRRKWQPIQYSCLENPMERGAWWATFHGVRKSQTQLSNQITTATMLYTKVVERGNPKSSHHKEKKFSIALMLHPYEINDVP